METKIINIIEASNLKTAVDSVVSGEPIIFPTDTVFGIGADIFNVDACRMIYSVKSRDVGKPLSAHVSSIDMAVSLVESPTPIFIKAAEIFLPGALAIIMPKKEIISTEITSGMNTISIRYPDNDLCTKLINAVGRPIAATSANVSGEKSLTNPNEILNVFSGKIHYIVDGNCTHNSESTIISLVDTPKILRLGVISKEELEDSLSVRFM